MFRFILLGLLRGGTAQHGYGLMKVYQGRSGITVNSGTVYRELRRLQTDGLIGVAKECSGCGGRRALYEITPAGIAAFEAWLLTPTARPSRRFDDALIHRAMFLGNAAETLAPQLLRNWQQELWFQSKVIERARRTAMERAEPSGAAFSPLPLLLSRRLRYLAAEMEFLDEIKAAHVEWRDEPPPRRASVRSAGHKRKAKTAADGATVDHLPPRRARNVAPSPSRPGAPLAAARAQAVAENASDPPRARHLGRG